MTAEEEFLAMQAGEKQEKWCLVIEVESQKVLRKFRIKDPKRRFLVWKEGLYYSDKDEAGFKHVLD